ncbi:uncharacterized protein TRAVEDRAFT_60246 [Trametes versicolor FP-101664 SS1]|uniref:uncharacterized protein n=1 Tax=Trametes versicolor (strain FP-101664) TaxID=717944 RepID=UPI0004624088|nr:uncharacterized protein TRAVEDRAFT_60246 [Trametes versicolor FP-101664 SS1]EIW54803.1 hypothetical protein TRAVEDRAFT_60246 [Trametes versicolor FP-101664 SS1]
MGLFSGWFKKSQPDDYEQVLAALSTDIQKRQTHLSEIRLRERRATLLFSVYAILLWIVYTSMWYKDFLPTLTAHKRNSQFEKTVEGVPVFLGPIVILFIRRIVQIWYTRIGDAEEKALVKLRKLQREKIEEVKQKTNYYSMRNLIERYEGGPGPTPPDTPAGLRQRIPPQGQQGRIQQPIPQTPQRNPQAMPQTPIARTMSPGLKQQLSPSPQRPLPPPRKQWFDKLADAILGDDDGSTTATGSRYALICQKCFSHNGLVKESVWEDAQYVCPKCGYFNPSARKMRELREGKKSQSPEGRSPVTPVAPQVPNGQFAPPLGAPVAAEAGPHVAQRAHEDASMSMEVDS